MYPRTILDDSQLSQNHNANSWRSIVIPFAPYIKTTKSPKHKRLQRVVMTSTSSLSSWHPAFMPHTVPSGEDAVHTISEYEEVETESPSMGSPGDREVEQSDLADNDGTTIEPAPVVEDSKVSEEVTTELTVPGSSIGVRNEDDLELDELQEASTTTPQGPEAIEVNSQPVHTEGSSSTFEEPNVLGFEHEDASFPSQAPGRPQSFARSAQSINWGEDDEVDPEWNSQATDTDPFRSMGASIRTNSFPAVPPRHIPESTEAHELSHSQAGEIMMEVEHAERNLFDEESGQGDDFFAQQNSETLLAESEITQDLQDSSWTPQFTAPEEADLVDDRFEEGVPLMQDSEPLHFQTYTASQTKTVMFSDGFKEEEEEDDFFSGIGSHDTDPAAQPLARKSTMQVLDSLHLQPDDELLEDEKETSPVQQLSSHVDKNLTGGGIAVSTSTVLSQVLGDPNHISAQESTGGNEPTEEDLAARWKAALDGDEFLDDDILLEDDLLEDGAPTSGLDPSTLFGSDDEGFLDDDNEPSSGFAAQSNSFQTPPPVSGSNGKAIHSNKSDLTPHPNSQQARSRYLPQAANANLPSPPGSSNSYIPTAPLFTNFVPQASGVQPPHPSVPYGSVISGPPTTNTFATPQPPKPELNKAASFVDKAKGGYTSPYDLPMDVTRPNLRPRKQMSMQQMTQSYNSAQPPPLGSSALRSSSMYSQGPPPSRGSTSSVPPPSNPNKSLSNPQSAVTGTNPPTLRSKASFFEELPMSSKVRPAGRYTPQPQSENQAAIDQTVQPTAQISQRPTAVPHTQSAQHSLVAPPPISPYASLAEVPPQAPTANARYSPAPVPMSVGTPPVGSSRYAAAPPAHPQSSSSYAPPPPSAPFAHQPRTSSPLAHFERSNESRALYTGSPMTPAGVGPHNSHVNGNFDPSMRSLQTSIPEDAGQEPRIMPVAPPLRQSSYQQYNPAAQSQSQYGNSVPTSRAAQPSQDTNHLPPQRSQTQSPGRLMGQSRVSMGAGDALPRPVSVHGPTSPREVVSAFTPVSPIAAPKTRTRGFSQNFNYVAPSDGREHDPLQRWRGGPVFAWGVGGIIVTSFPKEVPRYGMGNAAPTILVNPGEVKVRSLKQMNPLEERLATFPGPLKGKSKKKDVVAWLTAGIELLEKENSYLQTIPQLAHEDKRKEERVLLWKTLRVMIENDGILEGTSLVDKAVRSVLSPGLEPEDAGPVAQYTTGADLSGIHRRAGSVARAEAVDPSAVDALRKQLLRGEREKAVWEAVDKRLWAHAMLISNTVSKDLYKQVVQEFVQKEVKSIGENTESLAALYEVFASNFEESVDELVAPSARAGFQMVSASGPNGPAKDALDGLDRWRETLSLILSNRSSDDGRAILALGKLLSSYGRAEAAHICFIFARNLSIFGGSDDPNTNIVLLGSDHLRQPAEFDKELEPVLLSEVYEYALSLSSTTSISAAVPHLAAYKVRHALMLAEFGFRDKALQYCESIANAITSQTRRSPYHHALLVASLDDLSKRLKQSPKDGSSSWISKPSIDKVSSSVWTKFNKFVAGDENDAAASGTGEDGSDGGPFARIAGGTPTISRSPSLGDIYGSYPTGPSYGGSMPIPVALSRTGSRYAPGGTTNDAIIGSSFGSQPATPYSGPGPAPYDTSLYGASPQSGSVPSRYAPGQQNRYAPHSGSQYAPSAYSPSHPATPDTHPINSDSLQNSPHSIQSSRPAPLANGRASPSESFQQKQVETIGYQPSENGSYMQFEPTAQHFPSAFESPEDHGVYAPLAAEETTKQTEIFDSYQPPENSGYVPYEPEPDSPGETRPKKKSFIDDDDDDNIPALKRPAEKSKAEKDREADEAFRRAAEEDGKL